MKRFDLKLGIRLGVGMLTVAALSTLAHSAFTAVKPDGKMFYSGELLQNGVPFNGTQDFTIKLLRAPQDTTPVCTKPAVGQEVKNGKFRVSLEECAEAVRNNPSLHVTVDVGGTRIGVATPIGVVPYAFTANTADTANSAARADRAARVMAGETPTGTADPGIYSQSAAPLRLSTRRGPIKLYTDGSGEGAGAGTPALSVSESGLVSGKLDVYTKSATNVNALNCDAGDVALSGGALCHQEWDDLLLRSAPNVATGAPTGWVVTCMNHNNSSITNVPQTIYVVCMNSAQ